MSGISPEVQIPTQRVTRIKPRGAGERWEAEPGQRGAALSRAAAARRHEAPGVTCKSNSDSRAGINSPEEQQVNCKAEGCHAERKQPGLLEMPLCEVGRRVVTKQAELGRVLGTGTWLHAHWGIVAPRTGLGRCLCHGAAKHCSHSCCSTEGAQPPPPQMGKLSHRKARQHEKCPP